MSHLISSFYTFLLLLYFVPAATALEPLSDLTTIMLDQKTHFTGTDQTVIPVNPGIYLVQPGEGNSLILKPEEGQLVTIQAHPTEHDEELQHSVALFHALDEDRYSLALLQPEGKSLEAVGSLSGVQSRALPFFGKSRGYSKKQRKTIKAFAKQLIRNPSWSKVKQHWEALIRSFKRQNILKGPPDIQAVIFAVFREATLEMQRDLRATLKKKNQIISAVMKMQKAMYSSAMSIIRNL